MTQTECAISGCAKHQKSRGWCSKHYARWAKHGDPEFTLRPTWHQPPEVRFFAKVDVGDCWHWTGGTKNGGGYGSFWGDGGPVLAHRWLYEHLVRKLTTEETLDHLCRNRLCVNPDHIEPVPIRVNVLRGECPPSQNKRKTHCPQGHPYSGDNLRVYARPGGKPSRYCRACMRRHNQKEKVGA